MRTCVGCRSSFPKRDLVRIVRDPQGKVELDLTGKRSGRGAYLCRNVACLDLAAKGRQLDRALATPIDAEILAQIRRILNEQNL